jgi:hypothetical protein
MTDIVECLRAVDHASVEDCFLQSPLFHRAADEIERLRAALLDIKFYSGASSMTAFDEHAEYFRMAKFALDLHWREND